MNMTWSKMKKVVCIIFLGWFCATCDEESMKQELLEKSNVYLSAAITRPLTSKISYELETPTQEQPLYASVWASDVSCNYPDEGKSGREEDNGEVAVHTSVRFESGSPQLLDAVIYPQKDVISNLYPSVYFIGLYPKAETWKVDGDSKKAQFRFTGKEDVMFAPEISGNYGIAYENSPEFRFRHLLTLLKVKMIAENEEVMGVWGKIESIRITSHDQVSIDLSKVYDAASCLTYTNATTLPFYRKGSDDVFSGYTLEYRSSELEHPVEVAYVMCSPVVATDKGVAPLAEYTLTIQTDKRRVDLPVDLKKSVDTHFVGSTRGVCFTLNLIFKMGNTIAVHSEINDWEFSGFGNENLTE